MPSAESPDPAAAHRRSQPFLGFDFTPMSTRQAAEAIMGAADASKPLRYVVTPNVDHCVRLAREPDLRPAYQDAWLTLCDSRILELLAGIESLDMPASPGADLVERLLKSYWDPFQPIAIVGGDAALVQDLRALFTLSDIHWHEPPQGLRDKPEAIAAAADFVVHANAPLTFIAVGSPQQELVAAEAARQGAGGVAMCCGASLDFLTGRAARAPLWVRSARLEWLHRLLHQPARLWRRYLVDGPKIFSLWRKDRRARLQNRTPTGLMSP